MSVCVWLLRVACVCPGQRTKLVRERTCCFRDRGAQFVNRFHFYFPLFSSISLPYLSSSLFLSLTFFRRHPTKAFFQSVRFAPTSSAHPSSKTSARFSARLLWGNGAQCITQTQSRTCTMRFAHAHRPVVALTVALAPGDAASSVRFFFFFSFSSLTKWDWISVPCAIVVLLTRSCSIVARRFFQMMCHGERSLFLLCFE